MPASITHATCIALLLATMQDATARDSSSIQGSPMSRSPDGTGRFQTKVMLNGKGPYAFLIDTGATASVLSPAVAVQLQLSPGGSTRVTGGIGNASRMSVSISDYRSGLFDRHNETMTLLSGLSADGIIGMNAFVSQRIEFDLADSEVKAGASGQTPAGFVAAPGILRHGIMIVDVIIDGVPAKAVVDTGAPYSIGNPQLEAALGLKQGDTRVFAGETLVDSLAQEQPVSKAMVGKMAIGKVVIAKPTMRFARMPVFRALGMDDGPALILGIDQLSHLDAIAIDYPRAELQLRP